MAAQLFTQFQHPSSSNSSRKDSFSLFQKVQQPQVALEAAYISSAKENAMQPPILKTYSSSTTFGENVFFIQSKGLHAGRPLKKPIPNCFAAICCSKDHLDFWTSICNALWLSKKYHTLILGSVVPFIRIRETAKLLATMRQLDTESVKQTNKQLALISELHRVTIERAVNIRKLELATAQALTSLL